MQKGIVYTTFMQSNLPPHSFLPAEVRDQLYAVVNRMLGPDVEPLKPITRGLIGPPPPFDISKPNQHDSKAEFLLELNTVEECIEKIHQVCQLLIAVKDQDDKKAMRDRLQPIVDEKLRNRLPGRYLEGALELVRNNIAVIGGYRASLSVFIEFLQVLSERHTELKDQEGKFWNLSHRAPDYYARAIALRLAKLYSKKKGEFPTIGTAALSGEPSTSYTRALSEVFALLEINSGVRSPAEWAVSQLTEEDKFEEPRGLLGQIIGLGSTAESSNSDSEIARLLSKKGDQT